MGIVVEEKSTDRIEFLNKDKTGTGAYFIVWKELPWEGYTDYLDSAMNIEIDPTTQEPKTEMAKVQLGKVSDMLIQNGLVGLENVTTSAGRLLTKDDYRLLPFEYLMQIVQSIQVRNTGEAQNPNA